MHETLLALYFSWVDAAADSVCGNWVSDFWLLVHLHAHHELFHRHHLVNSVVPGVFGGIAGWKSLRHAVNVGFTHEFSNKAIILIAIWPLRILDRLAVFVIQRIL